MELEHSVVYGPVKSRRFGWDLGINLLPLDHKLCCFDCVYCQYGFTPGMKNDRYNFSSVGEINRAWENQVKICVARGIPIHHTTLSGNGEPTMHPRFADVVRGLTKWRDANRPEIKLALLTTGYRCSDSEIREAMDLLDERIVKLDSAVPEKWRSINRPILPLSFEEFKKSLCKITNLTLQTMFIQNWNDSEEDIKAWKTAIAEIQPMAVQIYTISRSPALANLKPVTQEFLQRLAEESLVIEAF